MKQRMTCLALAAAVVAGLGMSASSARAADDVRLVAIPIEGRPIPITDQDRANAFTTVVNALTPTAADKRVAAVTYMDDALTLLDMARTHLREGQGQPEIQRMAMAELMAASGKVSTAYLLMFHDREASAKIAPLAEQIALAERICYRNPQLASSLIQRDRPRLAAIYTSTLATMGGGAGTVPLEPLKHR